ncbi:unnamed protein product [marine sediment metagenome]|uniref:Uncharacterized protein n=2 Tax=marine sediment metagenome TaxID=412755 RepID=X1KWY6_9ZZZZ
MAFEVGIQFLDDYGRTTTRRFQNTETLIADALASVGTLITDFLMTSDLGTMKHDVAVRTVCDNAADTGANKDVGGTLHCVLDNAKLYPLRIPGIKDSMLNPDGSIDLVNAAITTYVANFETGGKFRVSEGNYVVDVLYGELDG